MSMRNLSLIDNLICGLDHALRSVTPGTQTTQRPTPKPDNDDTTALTEEERIHSAGLMRVNHAGEVCAQALYQGQALTARLTRVREKMEHAAGEEVDHLAWCEERLADLNSQPSALNPAWYGLSFGIGAAAGLVSDKLSLGFVAATEDQVCRHLARHLERLPQTDYYSQAIVKQMLIDEQRHADMALEAGGWEFPVPVKSAMTLVSSVMTTLSYHI